MPEFSKRAFYRLKPRRVGADGKLVPYTEKTLDLAWVVGQVSGWASVVIVTISSCAVGTSSMSDFKLAEVYSAADAHEAATIANLLENAGIRAQVVGDSIRSVAGELPLGQASAPRIWVLETDAPRARLVIDDYEVTRRESRLRANRTDWICSACGEEVPASFDACWNCDAPRQHDAPISCRLIEPDVGIPAVVTPASSAPRLASHSRWIEVGVVLLAIVFPYSIYSWARLFWPPAEPLPLKFSYFEGLGSGVQSSVVVIYLIWRCGEPWAKFGLSRPHWLLDPLGGLLICAVYAVAKLGLDRWLTGSLDPDQLERFVAATVPFAPPPSGIAECALVIVASIVGVFGSSLILQAYLIPRFEELLHSSWKGVLLTSAIFAGWQIEYGGYSIVHALIFGLLLGGAFCLFRRLWPVVVAQLFIEIIYGLAPRVS